MAVKYRTHISADCIGVGGVRQVPDVPEELRTPGIEIRNLAEKTLGTWLDIMELAEVASNNGDKIQRERFKRLAYMVHGSWAPVELYLHLEEDEYPGSQELEIETLRLMAAGCY